MSAQRQALITCPECSAERVVTETTDRRIRNGLRSPLCEKCREHWRHGTVYAYSEKGCRCEPCREAKRRKRLRYEGNLRAQGRPVDPRRYADRPGLREYKRLWAKRKYATDPAHREKMRERSRNVPKIVQRARQVVATAIRQGILVRPDHCSQCGVADYIEAAHSDYSKPLEVRWLCRPCHRRWDNAEPKAKAA